MWKCCKAIINFFQKNKYATLASLVLIVLLGTGLRVYRLGANSFSADEFLDMNSAYAYRMTNVWQAWDFNRGQVNDQDVFAPRDERAWMYKYQVAQVFKILPPTEEVARSVSVFWGAFSMILIYFVAVSFTKRRSIGILSAFLFAVSAMGIMYDRKFRMYAMFYPMYLMLSWLIFKLFEQYYDGKCKVVSFFQKYSGLNLIFLLPVALIGLLSLHLQLLTVNIAAAFFGYVLVQTILQIKKNKKLTLNKYSSYLISMIVAVVALQIILPQSLGIFWASIKFFINNSEYFSRILSDYSNPLFAVIFLIIGIRHLYVNEKLTKESLWLSTSLLVPLFMAAFMWKRTQGLQYVFFIQSFLIVLVATGVYAVAAFMRKQFKDSKYAFTIVILLSMLLLPRYAYFFDESNTYNRTDSGDYRKVFAYVKRNLQAGDVMITRNFRNYYLSGAHLKVYDFGGESAKEKLSVARIEEIRNQNAHGWIVLFDNDNLFLTEEARNYVDRNFERVNNVYLRQEVKVYRW
jgi:hypothetical protein